MNGGKYSVLRFSVSETNIQKRRTLLVFGTVQGSTGIAKARRCYLSVNGKMQGIVVTINGKPRMVAFETVLKTSSIIHIVKSRPTNFHAATKAVVAVNTSRKLKNSIQCDINCIVNFAKEIKRNAAFDCTVLQRFTLSRIVVKSSYPTAIVNSLVSIIHTITQTTTVDITIPPGGELRIDSDVFTVTLNGVNIIHAHDGDWIMLDNTLLNLIVDTGSGGNLQGQILFTQRYL